MASVDRGKVARDVKDMYDRLRENGMEDPAASIAAGAMLAAMMTGADR